MSDGERARVRNLEVLERVHQDLSAETHESYQGTDRSEMSDEHKDCAKMYGSEAILLRRKVK